MKQVSNNDRVVKLLSKYDTRMALTNRSLYWFGWYYFNEYFTHKSAKFHLGMARALQFEDSHRYLLEIIFRDSAKTSWAKIAVIWRVVFQKNKFMPYVCFDQAKAKSNLYDIAIELQTNKKIIRDFGQLFYEDLQGIEKKSKKKSIDEFITTTGIKLKAYSTAMSTRGEIHGSYRPDYYTLDDFENEKTKHSLAMTVGVKGFIEELLSGISADANVVFLGNKISNIGSVSTLETLAKGNKDFKVINIPLVKKGVIAWKSRFVETDAEALKINSKQPNKKKWVTSIEERKRTLGERRYQQEFMNVPISNEDSIIKQEWLEKSYYTTLDPDNRLHKVIMFDPQAGESKTADYYGLAVLGFYKKDIHRYLLSIQSGRDTQINQAALVVRTWQENEHVAMVGVEKILSQVAVYQLICDWKAGIIELPGVDKNNRSIPIIAVTPQGKDKVARLQMHEAAFERGEVHLHHTMKEFADKLCMFPEVEHDDDIDAVIYALDNSYKANFTIGDVSEYNAQDTVVGNVFSKKF